MVQGKDHIDVTALNFTFDAMNISSDGQGNSIVDLGQGNTVTVLGVNALTANDFYFV